MDQSIALPRVSPKNFQTMSDECHSVLKRIPGDGLKGKYAPVNVLGTLMYGPNLMPDFLLYWVNSKLNMSLSVREQELIILRMALHYNCEYVWKHHVPVAQEFKVTHEELLAVKDLPLPKIFSPREEALLVLTDEMVIHKNIDDKNWNQYKSVLSETDLIDLIHLISQYVLFSLTNNVMRVQVEPALNEIMSLHSKQ